ncbi:hypothetical protein ACHAPU_000130 [Fusarium lateritium]
MEELQKDFDIGLEEMQNEITLLHKISNTIRRASKETQDTKAAEVFRIRDDDGNDAEPFLQQLFVNYIRDRFGASEAICQRLADSMVLRRKRILYRRERYGNTAIRLPEVVAMPVISHPVLESTGQATQGRLKRRAVEVPGASIMQSTTLSPERFKRAAAPSVISVSKTVALSGTNELCFPPPPIARIMQKYKKIKKEIQEQHEKVNPKPALVEDIVIDGETFFSPAKDEQVPGHMDMKLRLALGEAWESCTKTIGEVTCPYCFHSLPVRDVVDEKKWK